MVQLNGMEELGDRARGCGALGRRVEKVTGCSKGMKVWELGVGLVVATRHLVTHVAPGDDAGVRGYSDALFPAVDSPLTLCAPHFHLSLFL